MNIGGGFRTLKDYWAEVRKIQKDLPDVVWITSIDDPYSTVGRRGGIVIDAYSETAAKMLIAGSHRLSTAEEIAAHQHQQQIAAAQHQRAEYARKGFAMVSVPPVKKK